MKNITDFLKVSSSFEKNCLNIVSGAVQSKKKQGYVLIFKEERLVQKVLNRNVFVKVFPVNSDSTTD